MSTIVFHAVEPDFFVSTKEPITPRKLSEFKAVALVEDDDLEVAFELTNHINHPWWNNEGVTCLVVRKQRSTSVGDVMKNSQGWFLVASVGFLPIFVNVDA